MSIVVPLVGTWIEIMVIYGLHNINKSFPLWERGLKYGMDTAKKKDRMSFPLWDRGLKFYER